MSDLLERDPGAAAIAKGERDALAAGRPKSDAELVRRFVRGRDEQAFVELERRFGPLVRGVCARALDRREDREDAYQATFLTLFLRAGSIRRRSSAACWLYGVAFRIASRLRRKRRLEKTEPGFEPPANEQEVWVQIDRKYLSEVLDAELQALPTTDRLPLAMHYLMGMTHQEIGQSLGLSASAVDGRLKRARHRLRTRLLSRGVGLASALAYLGTTSQQAHAASAAAEAVARGHELFRLFDGGAETSSLLSNAQGLYAEEAGMIATGWGKSAAVLGGAALACGGLLGIFWQGSFGSGVAQAQMGGMGGFYGGGGFGSPGGEGYGGATGPVVTVRLAGDQPPPQEGDAPFFSPLSEPPRTLALVSNVQPMGFFEQPLKDVLDAIEQQALVEIQIDRKALEENALTPDTAVTIRSESMTTADALDAILEPLGLTFIAKDRYLLITSKERAGEMMETRMYAIADHPLLRTADGNAIVNAIVGHVDPETWNVIGPGYGSVSLLPGVLIVTNDQKTLDKVEDFLAQYGKLLAKYEPAARARMGMGMGGEMYGGEGAYSEMSGAASPYGSAPGMSSADPYSPYGQGPAGRGVFGAAADSHQEGGGLSGFGGGQGGVGGGGGAEEVEEEGEGSGAPSTDPAAVPGAEGSADPDAGAGSAAPAAGLPGATGGIGGSIPPSSEYGGTPAAGLPGGTPSAGGGIGGSVTPAAGLPGGASAFGSGSR